MDGSWKIWTFLVDHRHLVKVNMIVTAVVDFQVPFSTVLLVRVSIAILRVGCVNRSQHIPDHKNTDIVKVRKHKKTREWEDFEYGQNKYWKGIIGEYFANYHPETHGH